jgi:hypothetical protein
MLGGAGTWASDYNNVLLHHVEIENARQDILKTWQSEAGGSVRLVRGHLCAIYRWRQKGRPVPLFMLSALAVCIAPLLQLMLRKVTAEC